VQVAFALHGQSCATRSFVFERSFFKVNFHRVQNDFVIFMLGVYVYTYFSAFLTILVTQARISAFLMLTQRSTDALLMDS